MREDNKFGFTSAPYPAEKTDKKNTCQGLKMAATFVSKELRELAYEVDTEGSLGAGTFRSWANLLDTAILEADLEAL